MNIKQDSFVLIQDYINAIQSTLYKWSIATNIGKREQEHKYEDVFLSGLSFETVMEMERLSIVELPAIIDKIKSVENMLRQHMETLQWDQNANYQQGTRQTQATK